MIYVTGDTHIPVDISKLNTAMFPQQQALTVKDYILICGDFGGIWDDSNEERYWLRWLNNKSFMTLFVDGNHENHKMLNENYPIIEFMGGKAHRISEKIHHLMRGQVFTIDGLDIFTMGGASSHDKERRIEGVSWWPQEMPSKQEYQEAAVVLESHGWNVDYIITHCAPDSIQSRVAQDYEKNELTHYFEKIREKTTFKKWYFGHYHVDKQVDDKFTCIYYDITPLEGEDCGRDRV